MTIEKKARWIAGTLTGLLLLALTSTVYYYSSSQDYKDEADRARLSQDSVMAVKQLLDKELAAMNAELGKAKGRTEELDKKIAESESILRDRQAQIDRLLADNATVSSLRRQLKDLRAERATMEKQLQDLLAENQQLLSENERLAQNVGRLQQDKLLLQEKLDAADLANAKAGNFRVDMIRNSSKVTAKAKRTNEISVSFDLPENLSAETGGNKEIYLVILDPAGKPVRNKSNKEVTLKDSRTITAVKTTDIDWSRNPQTVTMNVKLDSKLGQKGIYKVQIFTEDGMAGASQLRMN